MRALSLLQPWAGLLALGVKEYETRSFKTKFRGTVAIHASARLPKEGKALLAELAKKDSSFLPGRHRYQICTTLGCVVGQVEIKEVYSTNDADRIQRITPQEEQLGDYSPDRYFWECENPRLFDEPIPAKGQLGFWNWEESSTTHFNHQR